MAKNNRQSSERINYSAKIIRDGKCVNSVMRSTAQQALADLGAAEGDEVQVWKVRSVLHPVGKWWSERERVRVDGGAA